MNLPNMLTISRFFLACIFGVMASGNTFMDALAATVLFILASLTDWADGHLARQYGMITPFGQIMDPIADKCLTLTAFFVFASAGLFPLWAVIVVAAREIAVTMSRVQAVTRGQVLAAEQSGKIKTVVQITVISFALVYQLVMAHPASRGAVISYDIYLRNGLFMFMMVAVFLTLWSGWEYVRNLNNNGKI